MSKPKDVLEVDIPPELIKELLTPSEWRMVKQRMHIIQLLEEGKSVRAIASEAKVGTDTVVRMARKYESSNTLRAAFKQISSPKPPITSKWVFGKSENH